jgi:hypothetical protein
LTDRSADLSDVAARMYQRHRQGRRTTLVGCQQAIAAKVGDALDPSLAAAQLDARHLGWCQSRDWLDQGGRYVPWLDQWIISGKSDAEPPTPGSTSGEDDDWKIGL